MSVRHPVRTALLAAALTVVGFAVGAGGSAWQTRERRADPWRTIRVEHEGTDATSTRTRLLFESPKLPLQAVEVLGGPAGTLELGHVALRDGSELTVRYAAGGKHARPTALESPDGAKALFTYEGSKARVTFLDSKGAPAGNRVLTVPVELRAALRVARAPIEPPSPLAGLWDGLTAPLLGEAWAQQPEEDTISVQRDVMVELDIVAASSGAGDPGRADLEASCAPLTCVPADAGAQMPGKSTVRVGVSGSTKRSALPKPASPAAITPFEREAEEERDTASSVLPDVAAVVAVLGVTASACKSLKLGWPLCVEELTRNATSAAGAVHAITWHEVGRESVVIAQRAEQLYYEAQARAALDRELSIQLCVSRSGYARACTGIDGRPFAAAPMAPVARSVELRRGIGGTLEGSFTMTQSDGADCKFSPSPRTEGPLRLTFDNERHSVTAVLRANARGSRPNLRCSLGTANMSWSQNYSATLPQTFTAEQLGSGGKLPLRMTGTMNGSGGYTFSNCRSSGGASANCPGGKNESYSNRIELSGEIDLDSQTGSGRIVVFDAPLATSGSWRIPAEATR